MWIKFPVAIPEAIDKAIEVMQETLTTKEEAKQCLSCRENLDGMGTMVCGICEGYSMYAKKEQHDHITDIGKMIDNLPSHDVCPRCGSDKIVTTIYCNSCHQAH